MKEQRDLFLVVADQDAAYGMTALLGHRQKALGIELVFDLERDVLRFWGRDSGCFGKAEDLLRPKRPHYRHALVVFDRQGSGAEGMEREEIEIRVEKRLQRNGWPQGAAAALVIDPELEAWVWSESPHVAQVLGWGGQGAELREFLQRRGHWPAETAKPAAPKAAMEAALRQKNMAQSAGLFADLAARTSLRKCQDPAFQKLTSTLQAWFGVGPAQVL